MLSKKQVTKETVKQKDSVAANVIKRLYLFLSVLGGVGKSHVIKTIYQSITQILQNHDSSPVDVPGSKVYHALGTPFCGRLYPLDRKLLTSLHDK